MLVMLLLASCKKDRFVDCQYNILGTYTGTVRVYENGGAFYTDYGSITRQVILKDGGIAVINPDSNSDSERIKIDNCKGETTVKDDIGTSTFRAHFYQDSLYYYTYYPNGNPAEQGWNEYFLTK
jgi:major membrane immunogen (membrane-anchored lipoprotein)